MTNEQLFEYASDPSKIIDPQTCNYVISLLGGHISDLTEAEFEKRLISSQAKVNLLNTPNKTNGVAKAEWELSSEYKEWQEVVRTLRKYKAWRGDIKDRFLVLTQTKRY
jgi:hypothetical protein